MVTHMRRSLAPTSVVIEVVYLMYRTVVDIRTQPSCSCCQALNFSIVLLYCESYEIIYICKQCKGPVNEDPAHHVASSLPDYLALPGFPRARKTA